jgi:hypothetical protein
MRAQRASSGSNDMVGAMPRCHLLLAFKVMRPWGLDAGQAGTDEPIRVPTTLDGPCFWSAVRNVNTYHYILCISAYVVMLLRGFRS